jgi:hypothetical protein
MVIGDKLRKCTIRQVLKIRTYAVDRSLERRAYEEADHCRLTKSMCLAYHLSSIVSKQAKLFV